MRPQTFDSTVNTWLDYVKILKLFWINVEQEKLVRKRQTAQLSPIFTGI
jgi:hypothetical protein